MTRYSLSERQCEVLACVLDGLTVHEIANKLYVADSTVIFHLKRMIRKVNVSSRVALAARVLGWPPANESEKLSA
ncbi:MAG: helix-turn-helix transcriptional regulator [Candidatus Baltobacteraceae bacterium]